MAKRTAAQTLPEMETQAGERPSKSARKRERQAIACLAEQLGELSREALERVPLDEDLLQAVVALKGMQRGARQRQLRFVTGLLAQTDHSAIGDVLERLHQPHRLAVQALQEIESWRDALVAGETAPLNELAARFPAFERAHAARLAARANAERDRGQPATAARELFRYLRTLSEQQPAALPGVHEP